jgi:branched-chain amino acid transport system permease protein
MIGASFAGIAGGLFAARNFFTGPADHTLMVSINVLSGIIVGGLNSIGGIITGAFVLKGLPEILRQVEGFRMVTFGALLVVMMIWKPEGLWPSKRKNIFEGKQKSNDQEES